jgi:hypothetical protein
MPAKTILVMRYARDRLLACWLKETCAIVQIGTAAHIERDNLLHRRVRPRHLAVTQSCAPTLIGSGVLE